MISSAVNEDHTAERSQVFTLHQNVPNPFNPATTLSFHLVSPSRIRLAVYDLLGREVAVLAKGAYPAGTFSVRWDGRDRSGRAVSSGVYLSRLEAGGRADTRRMILVR